MFWAMEKPYRKPSANKNRIDPNVAYNIEGKGFRFASALARAEFLGRKCSLAYSEVWKLDCDKLEANYGAKIRGFHQ